MNLKLLNKIYDVLVECTDAIEYWRNDFVHSHSGVKGYICKEYRIPGGNIGFGGKYRIERNMVDYYAEDRTEEIDKIIEKTNHKLAEVLNKFKPKCKCVYKYNFPSVPNKRICTKCFNRQNLDLNTLIWNNGWVGERTNTELIDAWHN